jgi:DNA polymerase I-like protein with 3'-5' exonuclease and polymerase domains/uracil-DNA glycosylase
MNDEVDEYLNSEIERLKSLSHTPAVTSGLTTTRVTYDGPIDSDVVFIGEAPGSEENYRGIPFVGSAGQLLDRCLRSSGIGRSEILIWNVFRQQPPGNDVGYFYKDKKKTVLTEEGQKHVDELRVWLYKLSKNRRELGIGPWLIVALGEVAMNHLTGKRGITKRRGSLYDCTLVPGFKVYTTYHPSHVNRLINTPEEVKLQGEKKKDSQNVLPVFMRDLARIKYLLDNPEHKNIERQLKIIRECSEGVAALDGLIDAAEEAENHDDPKIEVSIDIETFPHISGPILWCIGFAPSPSYAFTIPFLENQKFVWSTKQETLLLQAISRVFLHPWINKIFHSHYDVVVLGKTYGLRCFPGTYQDTMVAHQMNHPYLRKSLALCSSIYTWENYYKDEGKEALGNRNDTQEFIYNMKDCAVTREMWPIIKDESFQLGTNTNYETSMYVMPSLVEMEIRGVKIDQEKKQRLTIDFAQRAKDYEEKIKILIDDRTINLNSSCQLSKLFYNKLGCEEIYSRKTGSLTTDKDALNKLLKRYPTPTSTIHQVLVNLVEYRKFEKLSETYTSLSTDQEGRIHTSYGFVSTLRLSSSESSFGGGGNLQNIPVRTEEGRMVRELFIADEGKTLIACDLAGAEAREVAWLAGDERLINLFLEGWDVHWEKTKRIFSFPADLELHKDEMISDIYTGTAHKMKFYRDLGKTIVHAGNYLMGAEMLQIILIRQGVWLELSVCKKLLAADRAANPLTVKWQQDTIEEVKATRTLITALGDVRIFRGRLNNNLFRSAIAYRPQSVVGRITQIGIQKITDDLGKLDVDILLNVHDEVICQAPDEKVDEIIPMVQARMMLPHELRGRTLTIPTEVKIGKNWGSLKEYKI